MSHAPHGPPAPAPAHAPAPDLHPIDAARLASLAGAHGLAAWERCPPHTPSTFGCMVAAAIADAEAQPALAAHAEQLARHYWSWMPAQRADQLSPTRRPQRDLFHAPLDLAHLPRLRAALDHLTHALAGADLDLSALGADALCALTRGDNPTLADLYSQCHFGQVMPMLYAYPSDLTAYAAELEAEAAHRPRALATSAVIDRRLTAPLLHDLLHGPRARAALFPPYFDECLAGHLGVWAMPSFAFPSHDDDNGILGAPWFSQVGLALLYAFGPRAILRAHLGAAPWPRALPTALTDAFARLGWARYQRTRSLHFLDDNTAPLPWVWRILWAASDPTRDLTPDPTPTPSAPDLPPLPDRFSLDAWAVEHALRSLYLRATLASGTPRVQHTLAHLPPDAHPTLCFPRALATRPALPDRIDLADPVHWLPPALCARWAAAGFHTLRLDLSHLAALPEAVAHLLGPPSLPSPAAPFRLTICNP